MRYEMTDSGIFRFRVSFRYADDPTGSEWRNRSHIVYANDEKSAEAKCVQICGLSEPYLRYEILSIERI